MDERPRKWYQLDSRSLSNLLVVCGGILLYLVLTHLPQVKALMGRFLDVLSPFIAGFIIAYLLNTPTNFFERKVYYNSAHKRTLAIVTVYLIALAVIMVLLQLILPQAGASFFSLVNNLSIYLENLNRMVQDLIQRFGLEGEGLTGFVDDYQTLIRKAADFLTSSMPNLLNFGVAVGSPGSSRSSFTPSFPPRACAISCRYPAGPTPSLWALSTASCWIPPLSAFSALCCPPSFASPMRY